MNFAQWPTVGSILVKKADCPLHLVPSQADATPADRERRRRMTAEFSPAKSI
jgi:hypothetical protein